MSAPHLPPKTCDVSWYRRLMFARGVFLILVVGLMSGATAALMVLAWYPQIVGVATPYGSYNITPIYVQQQKVPSDKGAHARTIKNAMVTMYRARDVVRQHGTSWYPENRSVGGGMLITDDGWILTTSNVAEKSTDLRVVDSRGTIYEVEKKVHDRLTGLSFVKVTGDGFNVVPVVEQSALCSGCVAYRLADVAFVEHRVGHVFYDKHEPLRTDQLTRLFVLENNNGVSEGTPFFDENGLLIGLAHNINERAVILPITAVRSLFSDVFAGHDIPKFSSYIKFIMMPDVVPADLNKDKQAPRVGAYILGVGQVGSKNFNGDVPSLLQGDIIIAIDEEQLSSAEGLTLMLARMRTKNEVLLTVYRNGEQIRVPLVL